MGKIRQGQLKMRPKIFFALGSLMAVIGLAASIIVSGFLFGLIRFSLRTHGPRGDERFTEMLASFPWWSLVIAITGIVIGVILLRRFSFSYKHNFLFIVILFTLAVALSGFLIDVLGFNDILLRRGPMQGILRGYQHSIDGASPGGVGPRWR